MSFWDLDDGTSAADNVTKEYDAGGGNFDPIPNNSDCLAEITQAKWQSKGEHSEKVRFIEIRWDIKAPEAYAKRVVFQKLWVSDLDPNAKDQEKAKAKKGKALRMLATIDANASGRLVGINEMPNDDMLAIALQGSSAVIKVMTWEMADARDPTNTMSGNWVSAVMGKDHQTSEGEAPKPNGAGAGGQPSSKGASWIDDEIPFAPEWRA